MKESKNTIIKGAGFHHIAIKTKDFDKSYKFYTEVLGFTPHIAWGEGNNRAAMLDIGDGGLVELFAGGTSAKEIQEEPMIHFCITVDACDFAYNRAIEAGCRSKSEPQSLTINGYEKNMPVRISFVIGYDGEVIEFFQILDS